MRMSTEGTGTCVAVSLCPSLPLVWLRISVSVCLCLSVCLSVSLLSRYKNVTERPSTNDAEIYLGKFTCGNQFAVTEQFVRFPAVSRAEILYAGGKITWSNYLLSCWEASQCTIGHVCPGILAAQLHSRIWAGLGVHSQPNAWNLSNCTLTGLTTLLRPSMICLFAVDSNIAFMWRFKHL